MARGQRVRHVASVCAVPGDVHAQVRPAGSEGVVDALQHAARILLVVHTVEGRDQVEQGRASKRRRVLHFELRIGQPEPRRLRSPQPDTFFREVVADEPAVRKRLCHQVDGVPGAAAHIGDVDPGLELVHEARGEGERHVYQRGVIYARTLFPHQLLELLELRVRHAAAVAERFDDAVLDVADKREILAHHGQVSGPSRARERCSMLGGEPVRSRGSVVRDDPARRQRAEPFSDVPLV